VYKEGLKMERKVSYLNIAFDRHTMVPGQNYFKMGKRTSGRGDKNILNIIKKKTIQKTLEGGGTVMHNTLDTQTGIKL